MSGPTIRQLARMIMLALDEEYPAPNRSQGLNRLLGLVEERFEVEAPGGLIEVESFVSRKTFAPMVTLRWNDLEAQLSAEEAKNHGYVVIECAEASISDAFLTRFLMEHLPASDESAQILGGMLTAFRRYREEQPVEAPS